MAKPKSEVFGGGLKIERVVEKCVVELLDNGPHNASDVSVIDDPIPLGVELALAMDSQFVAVAVESAALVADRHFGELVGGFKCEVLPEFEVCAEALFFIHRN